MSDAEAITELQIKLTHLERHIADQDREIFHLSRRLETLVQTVRAQQSKIDALAAGGGADDSAPPADEKPPHY